MGNDGNTFEWTCRRLDKITGNGNTSAYKYNADGIRTEKTVNGVTTKYYIEGNRIVLEKTGNEERAFWYDGDGHATAFTIYDASGMHPYYYIRNGQGDVIGLFDASGNIAARYTYDSWGNLLKITDGSGNDKTNDTTFAGYKNPLRYRGYYYDSETGLYSLLSRYYDPQTGRFINADEQLNPQDGMTGYNLYAYCGNNPIMYSDPCGTCTYYWFVFGLINCEKCSGVSPNPYKITPNAPLQQEIRESYQEPGEAILKTGAALTIASTTIAVAGAAIATGGSAAASTTAAKTASKKAVSTINQALKQLNKTGLRPGQTQISAKGVMNYVNNPKLLQGTGEIFRTGAQRFLVDGHHRMVAQTILGNGNFYTMPTNIMPSVTNIYWSKQWWEIGKVVIKVVK